MRKISKFKGGIFSQKMAFIGQKTSASGINSQKTVKFWQINPKCGGLSHFCAIQNPEKSKGAVLILSLLFLFIMTLFVTNLLEMSALEQKMATNFQLREESFELAEEGLMAGEAAVALDKIKNGQNPVPYTIELLQETPCISVTKGNNLENTSKGARFYRITSHAESAAPITLQSTYIIGANSEKSCYCTPRIVPEGRQSWRELF